MYICIYIYIYIYICIHTPEVPEQADRRDLRLLGHRRREEGQIGTTQTHSTPTTPV